MLSLLDSVVIGDEYEFRGDWDKCIVGLFPSVVLIVDVVSVDVCKVLDFVSSVVAFVVNVTFGIVVIVFLVVSGVSDVVDSVVVFVVVVVLDINTLTVEAFNDLAVDGNNVDVIVFVNVDFVVALKTVVLTVDAVVIVFVVVDCVDVVVVVNAVPTFNTFNVSSNPFEVSLSSLFDMSVISSRFPLAVK